MVGLQEELDWYCYRLYGIDREVATRAPDDVPPLRPGLRAFEVTLAERDAESRAALARKEEPDEAPTAWFERHGWEPHTTLDALPATERAIVEDRLARTAASRELGLVEQPTYKRRWYKPDHATEERDALRTWLADRIEDHVKARKEPWTVAQVAVALGSDPSVRAVAEVLEARSDYDLEALIEERVRTESVPNNKHHVFKPDGLIKRAAWEETWALSTARTRARRCLRRFLRSTDRATTFGQSTGRSAASSTCRRSRFIAQEDPDAGNRLGERLESGPGPARHCHELAKQTHWASGLALGCLGSHPLSGSSSDDLFAAIKDVNAFLNEAPKVFGGLRGGVGASSGSPGRLYHQAVVSDLAKSWPRPESLDRAKGPSVHQGRH